MSQPTLISIDRPDVPPLLISSRLRCQLVYFMAPPTSGRAQLADDEYWFDAIDVTTWLDEGVIYLVSPLDSANKTEVELSEEQEILLSWLNRNQVQHVRVVE